MWSDSGQAVLTVSRTVEDCMRNMVEEFGNIAPADLRKLLQDENDLLLLDVRTPMEHREDAIEGSVLLPLQELSFRADELPKDREIVVYCRVGNRSAYAAAYLARRGFTVSNLEGGIMAWNGAGAYARA